MCSTLMPRRSRIVTAVRDPYPHDPRLPSGRIFSYDVGPASAEEVSRLLVFLRQSHWPALRYASDWVEEHPDSQLTWALCSTLGEAVEGAIDSLAAVQHGNYYDQRREVRAAELIRRLVEGRPMHPTVGRLRRPMERMLLDVIQKHWGQGTRGQR